MFDQDLFHLCVQVQLVDVDSLVPGNDKMMMMFDHIGDDEDVTDENVSDENVDDNAC